MNTEQQQILIAIKQFPNAKPTVSFAGLIASLLCATVKLMTVIESENDRDTAERTLEKARQMLPDLDVETKVRISKDAAKEILAELEQGKCGFLAVGTEGAGVLTTLFFGSVAQYLVGHAQCPVLVVRGERNELKRMLVCTGGRNIAKPVIRLGARLAQAAQARITLLHIASPVPSMYTGLDEIEETLTELLQTDTPLARHLRWSARILDRYGVPAELKLRHGVVVDEILREAQRGDYDLIMLGSRTLTSRWHLLLMDDVTRQVLGHALCPVLVV